jgi:hypothetical protein
MSERLADAALQVQPSSHYFLIERDGEIVGGASAEVDTSGYGIVFRQHAFGALLDEADDSVVIRTRASYTPTLRFGHFRIEFERGGEMTTMSGQRTDDSLIAVSVDSRGRTAAPETVPGPDPLFLPASAAVPVMLLEQPREGTRRRVAMFDPLSRATRTIPLSVARESVFVVVDSAGFDAETRRWRPARSDTLRAWLLLTDNSSIRAWVDRGGAPVLRRVHGRWTIDLIGAQGRAVRLPGPERRRQDHDAAHDRGHPAPTSGTVRIAAWT